MAGLLRGIARTAVVSGTATAVSNNVSRRQSRRWAEKGSTQPGYLEPNQQREASVEDDTVKQLKQLAELRDQGIVTPEEFDAKKKQLLGI